MNFCKDCRHYAPEWDYEPDDRAYIMRGPLCKRPGNEEPPLDPVFGNPILPTCESERSNAERCGQQGKYFQARESTPPQPRAEDEQCRAEKDNAPERASAGKE